MGREFGRILGGVVLLLIPLMGLAETVYVIDVIRVGLRPDQKSNSKPLDVVPSGTPLEVISRENKFVKARSPDGIVGWIADGWVTSEEPPRQRLAALEAEHARLQDELQKQTAAAKEIEEQYNQVANSLAKVTGEIDSNVDELATLRERDAAAQEREQRLMTIGVAAVGGTALLCFFLGYATYRRKVSARFGGLSV